MSPQNMDDLDVIMQQWKHVGLETDADAIKVVGRILRIAKTIEQQLADLHRTFDLKQGEFDVLATLKRENKCHLTPSELYQSMLLTSGAMTSRLDRLEQKMLIQRKHCQQDRRKVLVSLTSSGKKLINTAYPAHFVLLEKLLSSIENKDKALLANLLKSTLASIDSSTIDTL